MPREPRPEQWNRLFEASRDGLLVLDVSTRKVIAANAAAGRLMSDQAEALLGREVDALFPAAAREQVSQLIRAGRRASVRPAAMRLEVLGARGEAVAVEASAAALDSTDTSEVLLSLRDLRAQFEAEEERKRLDTEVARLERLQALGRLAGAVAHEMNNVLAVVMSVASLARDDWRDHPAGGDFNLILDAARRGREMAQRLLGFVRSAPGKKGPQEIDAILHDVAGVVRQLSNGLVLVVEDLDARSLVVHGEGNRLHQALLNLGLNAIDALGAKGGRLTLRSRAVELRREQVPAASAARPGPCVRIEVEDSGPGFSPEAMEHAFEPFFTTKVGKGSGLGLATVWRTVADHGGFVAIEPARPRGARVVMFLPRAAEAQVDEAPPAHPQLSVEPGLALVVDDEPGLRHSCRRLLERLGFQVLVAENGRAAVDLAAARRGALSVVLLDLAMPGLSGLETTERLRALDPSVPIVLMSGYSEERVPPALLSQPAIDFLPKPFSMEEFDTAILRTARNPPAAAEGIAPAIPAPPRAGVR